MQTKSRFMSCLIIVLIVATLIGCVRNTQSNIPKDEQQTDVTYIVKQTDADTKPETEDTKKIETETDKECDAEDVIELIEPEIITEAEPITYETEPIIHETEPETEPESIAEIEQSVEIEPLFYLSDYERWIAECIVMGESGAEPYEGQILVAQCLLNACLKDDLHPSKVRTKYKYSGWNDNPSDSVKEAVSAVFDDGYKVTEEFILYFYAPKYLKSKWHETQRFVIEIGGHRFFAEWD